jgi:hypothetical protein
MLRMQALPFSRAACCVASEHRSRHWRLAGGTLFPLVPADQVGLGPPRLGESPGLSREILANPRQSRLLGPLHICSCTIR